MIVGFREGAGMHEREVEIEVGMEDKSLDDIQVEVDIPHETFGTAAREIMDGHGIRIHHILEIRCRSQIPSQVFAEMIQAALRITDRIPWSHGHGGGYHGRPGLRIVVQGPARFCGREIQGTAEFQPFLNLGRSAVMKIQPVVPGSDDGTVLRKPVRAESLAHLLASGIHGNIIVLDGGVAEDFVLPVGILGTVVETLSRHIGSYREIRKASDAGIVQPSVDAACTICFKFSRTGSVQFQHRLQMLLRLHQIQFAPSALHSGIGLECHRSLLVHGRRLGGDENDAVRGT